MGTFAQIAENRRSIRKYEDKDVDTREILECLRIATTAPSGCNSQCWKFMLIHNKKKIADIADLVTKKEEELLCTVNMKYEPVYFDSRINVLTFFKNAPVCIAVYMTRLDYYDKKLEQALCEFGYTYDGLMELFGFPDLLSVGAAIQNLFP
jgi:nitroreductase